MTVYTKVKVTTDEVVTSKSETAGAWIVSKNKAHVLYHVISPLLYTPYIQYVMHPLSLFQIYIHCCHCQNLMIKKKTF